METEVETRSTGTWIHVKGRLDMASAPDLDRQLDELIRDGHRDLILDLGQLEYVSSAGLRSFLSAAKKLEPDGGRLVFVALQEFVLKIFEITGLNKLFRVCASADEV